MRSMCDRVHEFADGELPPAETESFQEHLRDCHGCARELESIFALKGLAETSLARSAAPATREIRQVRRAPIRAWLFGGGAGLVVAAAAVVALVPRLTPSPADTPWLAQNESRTVEPRLSDPRADRYGRHEQMRGAEDGKPVEDYTVVAVLEKRGDVKGLVNRALFLGEAARAHTLLDQPETAAGFDNERAALALLERQPKVALARTSALLARQPRAPQALWNRALALRDLRADRAAAAAFEVVAGLGESGWSEEARMRATDLRRNAEERQRRWQAADSAVDRVVTEGALIPADLVTRFPDLVRARFYEALAAASTRPALERLRRVALALDQQYQEPGVLAGALDRVLRLDLDRRAQLAARYTTLRAAGWPAPAVAGYVAALRKAGPVGRDLLLGVLLAGAATAQPGELTRLAKEQQDPWFEAAAVEATLGAGPVGGEPARDQRLVQAAEQARQHHLEAARLRLDLYRAYLLIEEGRQADAEKPIERALEAAQSSGLLSFESLPLLKRAARYTGNDELLAAYRDEVLAANLPGVK